MSIDSYRQTYTQTTSAALAEAASVGEQAPSILDSRPWRWRVANETLELCAEPTCQPPGSDPGGRRLVLSCGAALHHARISLAAQGWRVEVERMPVADQPRILARLRLPGRQAVTREAMRQLQTIRIRRTDRRASDTPVVSADIAAVRSAVEVEQARLYTLRPEDVLALAAAADQALTLEEFDPNWRDEIASWAGTGHRAASIAHDDGASYDVLFGNEDTPNAWLYAGEALSAAWLTATEHRISVKPLSAVVEVETTRVVLGRLLAQLGAPFLILRLGTPRHPVGPTVAVAGSTRHDVALPRSSVEGLAEMSSVNTVVAP